MHLDHLAFTKNRLEAFCWELHQCQIENGITIRHIELTPNPLGNIKKTFGRSKHFSKNT